LNADRDVHVLGDEIDAPTRALELNPHARIRRHEPREHLTNLEVEHRRRTRQPDEALRRRARAIDGFLGGVGLDEHRGRVPVVLLSNVGHLKAARRPLDQPNAETRLELGDAPAQRRLGHAKCSTRRRKAAMVDDLREGVEVVEVAHDCLIVPWMGH
jgi:hypothetical protein